jgi:hypothetical protein
MYFERQGNGLPLGPADQISGEIRASARRHPSSIACDASLGFGLIQSALMPAVLMIGHHFAISAR